MFDLDLYIERRIMTEIRFDTFFDILFQHPLGQFARVDACGPRVNPNLAILDRACHR